MQRRGLIVDDEAAVCEMVGKVLSSVGMEALKITKSAEAPSLRRAARGGTGPRQLL